MHYDNGEWVKNNYALIVIYKHEVGVEDLDEFYYQITSIQKAVLLDFHHLRKLESAFEYIFKDELEKLEAERYYLVKVRIFECYNSKFEWVSCQDVTDSKDPFHHLH